MSKISSSLLAAAIGAVLLAAPVAAVAEPMAPLVTPALASGTGGATLQDVRFRGGRGFGGGFGGFGLGLLGGAIIGGALANDYYGNDYGPSYGYYPDNYGISYCASRFRSYDARSETYLGYDGFRHHCS